MRFPSFPSIVRTFTILSNTTTLATLSSSSRQSATSLLQRAFSSQSSTPLLFARSNPVLKSMPSIPFLGSLFSSSAATSKNDDKMSYPDQRSDDEWRAVLSKDQFRILREKGTEAPFTGAYNTHAPPTGTYTCAGCSAPLYHANHKFKSSCGWPAYFDSIPGAVTRHTDSSFGMSRTEILCSNCGGHLGHVFKGEGYPTPTDERHCVNSVSLKFNKDDPVVDGGGEEGKKDGQSKA